MEKCHIYRTKNKEEIKDRKSEHYQTNKNAILASQKLYYEKMHRQISETEKQRRMRDPERYRAKSRADYVRHREKRLVKVHEYRQLNLERIQEYDRNRARNCDPDYRDKERIRRQKYYLDNIEKEKERSREKARNNPSQKLAWSAARRALKINATPSWASLSDIARVYKDAVSKGLTVDHIVPLRHPKVCGLHVPCNLQLLTASQNSKKHNKFCLEDLGQCQL